jgi:hypothetical protein
MLPLVMAQGYVAYFPGRHEHDPGYIPLLGLERVGERASRFSHCLTSVVHRFLRRPVALECVLSRCQWGRLGPRLWGYSWRKGSARDDVLA